MMVYNTIIIGGGPAGLTAGIYTSRAMLNPLLFEGFMACGVPAGGQLMFTTYIENFPGFPEKILASELMQRIRQQAINNGTKIETKTVDKVDLSVYPFKVFVGSDIFETKTLIVATGATAKRLHIPGEEIYWQKGISACAVCDGGLPAFRNQELAVVGGGDTACEEALYLTKFASKVYMFVRGDTMKASKIMQQKVKDSDKIEIVWNTSVIEAKGDGKSLQEVVLKNNITGDIKVQKIRGLFYAIGHKPNTDIFKGQLELTEDGYIVTKPGTTQTSVKGVFACGDVQDKIYRQAITSAGTGCMAAIETERFLS